METELRVAAPTVARVAARVAAAVVATMVVVMVAATWAVTMVVVMVAATRAVPMVAARVTATKAVAMVVVMVAATKAVAMVVVMVAAMRAVALVIAGGKEEEAEREASSVAPKAEELPVVPVGRVMTRWSASAQRQGERRRSHSARRSSFLAWRYSLGQGGEICGQTREQHITRHVRQA